jgi:hypothetical protein
MSMVEYGVFYHIKILPNLKQLQINKEMINTYLNFIMRVN